MRNIEIGIDLGTTNSEIAIFNNGMVEIVKNTYGDEFTPSVFGVNKAKDEEVGKKPYERFFKDATADEIRNNKPEIKRLMGTSDLINFPRINKDYNAEEISSKILSALKQEAIRKNENINTNAAVITIPAYFSTVQAEATKRAGELAGFKYVILLQEPIAAAISYGFGKIQNENWLVYDLGGGTFDSALISSKEGNLKVLSHNGDNFLGGKDIDNLIVDKVVLPILSEKYNVNDFNRANKKYSSEFAKLKYAAEQAKIQLSSLVEASIEVDLTIEDTEIYENIVISQNKLEELLNSMITKTIDLCKQTIQEAGIKTESVDKIILVGGPTQLPFIRKRLEEELNIKVDTSSDALTAVAKGACIYAMGQNIPSKYCEEKKYDDSTYEILLNYESLTSEEDELITGLIPSLKEKTEDFFVQIQSKDNTFNTGKIKVKDGKFVSNVVVKAGTLNSYWLYLFDKDGNILNVSIDEFNITHGLTISGTPIPHTVGVGISFKDYTTGILNQKYDVFFDKNAILPLEKTVTYKTVRTVQKGEEYNCLPITVYEGENENPEQNIFVCEIKLNGTDLDFDLYEGSDIEVTIKIDESRTLSLEAYIPIMDKCYNARASVYDENINMDKLKSDVSEEINKINEIEHLCSYEEKEGIYAEIQDIKISLQNSQNDEDEKRKTNLKIKKLQSEVSKLQKLKNENGLKQEFSELVETLDYQISKIPDTEKQHEFKKRFNAIKQDGQQAIEKNNILLLSKTNDQLKDLIRAIIVSNDYTWIYWFGNLLKNPNILNNQNAQVYIENGIIAANSGNIDELKDCVRNLWEFLPEDEQNKLETKIAGITR